MKKEHRKLVGRRFEDFIKNGINLELTLEEKIWQNTITDVRYHSLMDRRKEVRRKTDREYSDENYIYCPLTAAIRISSFNDEE